MSIKSLIRRWFPNDAFTGDWYGWLTNQISHIALGAAMAAVISGICYLLIGEFPYKWAAWVACAGIYATLELIRGWDGWDTVEDWVFVSIYGAGASFLTFSEVVPGSPTLVMSMADLPWLISVSMVHLAVGAWLRGRDA